MAIAMAGEQVPRKVTYTEKETSRRGGDGYKIVHEFEKGAPENIRDTIPVLFLWHVIQQAINLDEESEPDTDWTHAHIVQTLFLQKQTMACDWEHLCFLQREITQLQKWMVSVFPPIAAHFVHQQQCTHVETMGDALEFKFWKPILNYSIFTTRRIKSTCYHHFLV